jgi:NitT/TauT family transport system ATP-binding protein
MSFDPKSAGELPDPAVTLQAIRIAYSTGDDTYVAVDGVDFVVGAHEFVALVGPTGCGKSSLLNLIAGLASPQAGRVLVGGAPLSGLNKRAGYLFQQDALLPWKNARDNVAVALEVAGIARTEAQARADGWLARVGLSAFADRYSHQLSGGQRKRVALAQMLIRDPDILLMDEPFGPLDAQTRSLMGDLLLDLWVKDRKAVLFVTHDLDEAIALADRVLVMSAGPAARIIADHRIDLPRPRDAVGIKLDPRFHALQGAIWNDLRDQVLTAWRAEDGTERNA